MALIYFTSWWWPSEPPQSALDLTQEVTLLLPFPLGMLIGGSKCIWEPGVPGDHLALQSDCILSTSLSLRMPALATSCVHAQELHGGFLLAPGWPSRSDLRLIMFRLRWPHQVVDQRCVWTNTSMHHSPAWPPSSLSLGPPHPYVRKTQSVAALPISPPTLVPS